jgi:type IV pilus assembly protein PilW
MLNLRGASARQGGFSLVELMVAVTLGLFILVGLSTVFLNSARSRDETERSNRQIESGRYALQALSEDLRLAGYLGEFDVNGAALPTPAALPDPCSVRLADITASLMMHIQGYDVLAGKTAGLTCITDTMLGSDIVVIRRASSCVKGAAGCDDIVNAPYFQASTCNSSAELGSLAITDAFRLDTVVANLDRHKKNCLPTAPGTLADTRRFLTRIYYVANNDQAGDGIPTLKRADMGAGTFNVVSIAQGIETLQLEYGIDANADGLPEAYSADPNAFGACAGATCVKNWMDAVTVKINVMARNPSPTYGAPTDPRTYVLGLLADGKTANTFGPFSDMVKRHVYQAEVRLTNPAGRREK